LTTRRISACAQVAAAPLADGDPDASPTREPIAEGVASSAQATRAVKRRLIAVRIVLMSLRL
jgi:hypothetical protein